MKEKRRAKKVEKEKIFWRRKNNPPIYLFFFSLVCHLKREEFLYLETIERFRLKPTIKQLAGVVAIFYLLNDSLKEI